MKTLHLIISGKVQGVFFRAKAKKVAEKYEIKGWIKNTADEKVEALITGEPGNLNEFVTWCKTGPERAKVEDVIISQKPEIIFENFEVIREKNGG